jgi:hypothetical protein
MWPLDDPAIAELADDARLIDTEGNETTVAAIRAGRRAGGVAPAERAETAAPAPAADAAPSNGIVRAIFWFVTLAVLLVGARALMRPGPPRKKVRPSRPPR